ncbi:hypothetical protein R3W88_005547 [Solanum pinnatisectum]|uniref:Uncharacterized protein n=1 Tax=Solanum pinnatisectum TaxID=50273 RepID=A0AAV9KEL2_9SOLN|nr:hypothetical protein R3W88_005547 [Solanum pinnatisectum]
MSNLELMKPKFVSDDDNLLNENYQLQHDIFEKKKLNHELKRTKVEHAQLPKDEIRMLLEEVKYQQYYRNATGKEKKNDEKFQKTAINPLNLLMNNNIIDEVNAKLDGENHNPRGKKFASAEKGQTNGLQTDSFTSFLGELNFVCCKLDVLQ